MKTKSMKLKLIAVALALAAAGNAHAALVDGSAGDSSLILNVTYTDTLNPTGVSALFNLGYLMSQVQTWQGETGTVGTPTRSWNLATGNYGAAWGQFSNYVGTLAPTNGVPAMARVQWNVGALDGLGAVNLLTTVTPGTDTLTTNPGNTSNTNMGGIPFNNTPLWQKNQTRGNHLTTTGASVNGPGLGLATDQGWFDFGSKGEKWQGLAGFDSTNALGNRSTFWMITQSGASGAATETAFRKDLDGDGLFEIDNNGAAPGGDLEFSTFSLSSTGMLTYNAPVAASVVPVPAAVWLLGSGLIGMVGVARRKQLKA